MVRIIDLSMYISIIEPVHTMSIFAQCMRRGESLASLSSGPLPRKDTERGLRVVWPVQMVYELMRSMWRGRCSLDT